MICLVELLKQVATNIHPLSLLHATSIESRCHKIGLVLQLVYFSNILYMCSFYHGENTCVDKYNKLAQML